MSTKVLLVEDEAGLAVALRDRLQSQGYEVEVSPDGEQGLARARTRAFDLILLDAMLPGLDGFEVCRSLRRADVTTPILMLTARAQLADKVQGLKLGADDYLTKPFENAELFARMEALLRRTSRRRPPGRVFRFGDVEVDFQNAEVRRASEPLALSAREFGLLRYFIEHRGEVVTRDELLRRVWGHERAPLTRTVDVHVTWLRSKVEPDRSRPRFIVTVHGHGYKFVPEG